MLNHLDTLLTSPFCTKWDLTSVLAKGSVFLTLHTLYTAHLASLTQQQLPSAAKAQGTPASAGPEPSLMGPAAGAGPVGAFGSLLGVLAGRASRASRDALPVV